MIEKRKNGIPVSFRNADKIVWDKQSLVDKEETEKKNNRGKKTIYEN